MIIQLWGQQEYNIRSITAGVSLLQGFRSTGAQERRSSEVSNVW